MALGRGIGADVVTAVASTATPGFLGTAHTACFPEPRWTDRCCDRCRRSREPSCRRWSTVSPIRPRPGSSIRELQRASVRSASGRCSGLDSSRTAFAGTSARGHHRTDGSGMIGLTRKSNATPERCGAPGSPGTRRSSRMRRFVRMHESPASESAVPEHPGVLLHSNGRLELRVWPRARQSARLFLRVPAVSP